MFRRRAICDVSIFGKTGDGMGGVGPEISTKKNLSPTNKYSRPQEPPFFPFQRNTSPSLGIKYLTFPRSSL